MPDFVATCARGTEELLADELRALPGVVGVALDRGAVRFSGGREAGYRACLWSRVASRVLLVLRSGPCPDKEALYHGVRSLDWSQHLGRDGTVAVDFVGVSDTLRDSRFGAQTTKDAIVDQFRARTGERPSVDKEQPDVRVNVHLRDGRATVCVDLSGEPLHRRGLGREAGEAPLKENLAAAILLLAGWPAAALAGTPLVDPMCGSGTFLLEAGGMAFDRAPGLGRMRWGFDGWAPHDAALWKRLLYEANDRMRAAADRPVALYGSDCDPEMIRTSRYNLARAQVPVALAVQALVDCHPPATQRAEVPRGLLVTNPPYGMRLEDAEGARQVGADLGGMLRRRFLGWRAFVLAGGSDLAHGIGLKTTRRTPLWNGPIECRLLQLDIHDAPVSGLGPGWG